MEWIYQTKLQNSVFAHYLYGKCACVRNFFPRVVVVVVIFSLKTNFIFILILAFRLFLSNFIQRNDNIVRMCVSDAH